MVSKTDINPKTGKAYAINPNSGVWDDNYWANDIDPVVNAEAKRQQATTQFAEGQRAREGEFLGRFKSGLSSASTAIESELGLPQLRTNAQAAGVAARGVGDQVRSIAPTQQTIGKQVGISAPRLQQRISAKTAQMAPTVDAATRALEEANSSQQFGETEYTRRINQEMTPYNVEASMLSDSLAREMTGFTQNQQNELTVMLQKMTQGHQLSMLEMQRVNDLVDAETEFERQKQLVSFGTDENIRQSKALKSINGNGGTNLSNYLTPKTTTAGGNTIVSGNVSQAPDLMTLWDTMGMSANSAGMTSPVTGTPKAKPYVSGYKS